MHPRFWPLLAAAAALHGGMAVAACPSGPARSCVNLDGMSDISQQIVAREPHVAAKKEAVPFGAAATPYTGPTVGLTNTVRKTPTVGYHWSID